MGKFLVYSACLVPFARLIFLGLNNDLSANPLEFVLRSTGTWTLVLLCLSLAMTPLKHLTGAPKWIKWRKSLGLFCFFYAFLHAAAWFLLDQGGDFLIAWQDVLKRNFILVGFIAFILLIPLAITSNKMMIRKLGRSWSLLHRTVYAIAALSILHYWLHKAGKNDFFEVTIYAAVVFILLSARVFWWWKNKRVKK